MSMSSWKPHSGASIASALWTSTRASPERTVSGHGSAGGSPGSNCPSTSRPQTFSNGTLPTSSSMSMPRYRSAPPSLSGSAISVAKATTPSRPDCTSLLMPHRLGSTLLMLDTDLLFRPAGELAGLVRRGDISSRELVETSVRRIEALDPQLGAFIDVDGERAIEEASNVGTGDPRPFA